MPDINIRSVLTKWLSFTILKNSTAEEISIFRKIEKIKTKSTKIIGHRRFNETCIVNKLLPTYTNITI